MQNTPQKQRLNHSPLKGFLPFFWLALACVGGIWLADVLALPSWTWAMGSGLSLILWLLPKYLSEKKCTHPPTASMDAG